MKSDFNGLVVKEVEDKDQDYFPLMREEVVK